MEKASSAFIIVFRGRVVGRRRCSLGYVNEGESTPNETKSWSAMTLTTTTTQSTPTRVSLALVATTTVRRAHGGSPRSTLTGDALCLLCACAVDANDAAVLAGTTIACSFENRV